MDYEKMYDEKVARLKAAANHEKVDHVPLISNIQTTAIAYAGETGQELLKDRNREFEAYAKILRDFYFDGTLLFGINRPFSVYDPLGSCNGFFSEDGVTLQQHDQKGQIPDDELDEFIENPMKYIQSKILYRRYPNLRQEPPKDKEALFAAFGGLMQYMEKTNAVPKFLREHVGTPLVTGDTVEAAFDRYDALRGVVNGYSDLRRRPEKVLEAMKAIEFLVMPSQPAYLDFPWVFAPVVTVSYLSRKNFEKFFWPTYKRQLDAIISKGGKVIIGLEGSWSHAYDYLREFPKGSIVAVVEDDDMIQAKKDIGDRVAIAGGISINMLKNKTKQECVDHVRHIIDECGMEGILITMSQSALSPNDLNYENLKAVNEFVRDYHV